MSALDEKWPTTGGDFNVWNIDAPRFVSLISRHQGFWGADFDLKYLNIRIDTRNDHFILTAGEGECISPDRVVAAINKYRSWYPSLFDENGRVEEPA